MWRRFLISFAITGAAAFSLCLALILLADPFGEAPNGLSLPKSGYAIKDRRFLAPQVIGSEHFDSFLVGTSTIHSVDPAWAETAFGGRFANVSIHGATPYETGQVVQLMGRRVPKLKRIVLGLDVGRWCEKTAPARYNARALFPEWLYDDNPVNDFASIFNLKALRLAVSQLGIAFGLRQPAVPADGYRNELDEAKWSATKARQKICGRTCDEEEAAPDESEQADATAVSSAGQHPALELLEPALASLPPSTKIIVVLMPHYASALPRTPEDRQSINQCKREIAALAGRHGGDVIDFAIRSAWTTEIDNFWDVDHFRERLARDLIDRLKEAEQERDDARDGVYRFLTAPATVLRCAEKQPCALTPKPAD